MNSSRNHYLLSTARKYDFIIFDLDGTLLDTSEGILSSVKYTIDFFHLDPLSEEKMRTFIGPPIQKSFAREYNVRPELADNYAAVFRDRYKAFDLLKAKPYPGIINTLKELRSRGIVLGVATYKREDYALKLLDYYGFVQLFDVIHGSDFSGKQTKKDIILECINEVQLQDHNRIVLIGDTDSDAVGANDVGIHFVGVTYGFGYKKGEIINSADRMINYPLELLDSI